LIVCVLLYCGSDFKFDLYAQGGTVTGNQVEITYKSSCSGCVNAIGADILFNPERIQFDSALVYGVFEHEVVNLPEAGRVAFSFNSENAICGMDSVSVFTLYFSINSNAEGGTCDIRIENGTAIKNGNEIRVDMKNFQFFIEHVFRSWFELNE
jgi:hypothetical protein